MKGLQNPRPLFICDQCGWRKVAHSRFIVAQPEPGIEPRYEVEVLGDPYWWHITRRIGKRRFTISAVRLYTETHSEAEQFARRLHSHGEHYRINKV